MQSKNEEWLIQAEKVFDSINKEVSFNKYIMPINLRKENNKFKENYVSQKLYNPKYIYRDTSNIDFEVLYKKLNELSFPCSAIGKIYEEEKKVKYYSLKLFENIGKEDMVTNIGNKMHGIPNKSHIKKAEEFLNLASKQEVKEYTAEELSERVGKCLEAYGFQWEINISYEMPAKVSVNPAKKIVYINGNQKFSKGDIGRLCVHEISTHVLRMENGSCRKYDIFKNGTPNSLATEEGLALYNEEISGNMNTDMLKLYAARFISAINMNNMTFYEMVKEIESYIGLDNAIYVVARIKIGLEDTSKHGGFVRDYVYFQGYIDVKNAIEKDRALYEKLYYGSIGLEDINVLEEAIQKAIISKKVILPNY